MDPLHFCIAVAPLAVYLFLLGVLNLKGFPFVTTGSRDSAALAIGMVGFVIIGPMELFFPEGAASRFVAWVWIMLIIFYALCISLVVLLMRSRIVIYNVTQEQLRPLLTSVAIKLDRGSRWSGDSLFLPEKQVHLHIETNDLLRNVQLTAGGNNQSYEGWEALEKELHKALKKMPVGPNMTGIPLLVISASLAIASAVWMLNDQAAVAQALQDLLRK